MNVAVSFRVPRELKRKMDELRGLVNWSEKVRKFIESRVKEYEQLRAIEELEEIIKSIPMVPKGTATRYVRENRDSR
ncbi:MAG: CopG family transcriptional regulator [Thermoproteales archaeon]|nr:CopG family transcriptional regulator [Thermoproteales archaeon]